ncbi:MAG TPA: metal ABC transporter substrate-binding protein [bacterium]|nr:metal ABC transporter substrate-binding protein [bacterium]
MKKLFLILLCFGLPLFGNTSQIEIVATSSNIATCVKQIGQSKVNVTVLIPPGICPGHYEVKPNDIKKLYNNGILLYHGWEGFIDDISKAASGSGARIFQVDINGNWLIPAVQILAAEKITEILSSIDPENKKFYEKNFALYKNHMTALDRKVKTIVSANKIKDIPVISSVMQKELLEYLGLKVIGCFGRDEEITPGMITQLIGDAEKYNVKLIVSNLQSGTSTGEMLAKQVHKFHVVLSNFPGGLQGTDNIENTLLKNLQIIIDSLKASR